MSQKLEFDENKVCHDVAIPRYPNITPYGEKNYHQDLTFAVYQRQAFVEGARWQFEQSQGRIEKLEDSLKHHVDACDGYSQRQVLLDQELTAKDQEIQRLREALGVAHSWLIKHDSHGSRMQALYIRGALNYKGGVNE